MSGWESNSFPKLKYMAKYLDKIKKLIENMLESKDMETRYHGALLFMALRCGFRRGYVSNKNQGLITLKAENYKFSGTCSSIQFIGKNRALNKCSFCDKKVVRILNESIKHKLLQKNRSVKLNPYLAKISPHLNVRLFRTWLASCYYIEEINNLVKSRSAD